MSPSIDIDDRENERKTSGNSENENKQESVRKAKDEKRIQKEKANKTSTNKERPDILSKTQQKRYHQ